MHIFVTGEIGVGKSTLLEALLNCLGDSPYYGFKTKKISPEGKAGDTGKVYIFPAEMRSIRPEDGCCAAEILGQGVFSSHTEVFDSYGVRLLTDIPSGSVVLMDEIGFLEAGARGFCSQIMRIINGDYLVLGAIKPKSSPLLDEIRRNKSALVFTVTEKNRDVLKHDLIKILREQMDDRPKGKNV